MLIALDLDCVLADFLYKLKFSVKELFGVDDIDYSTSIYGADFQYNFCLTDSEEDMLMKKIFETHDNFPSIWGAKEGCVKLLENGHDLMVITARRSKVMAQEWLRLNNFGDIHVCLTREKNEIAYFDCLLDDSPKKIAQLIHKVKKQAFLFDTAQNSKSYDMLHRYKRVIGWPHFVEEISKISSSLPRVF